MSPKAKNYLIIVLAAIACTTSSIAWNQSRRVADLQADMAKASAAAAAVTPKPAPVAASFTAPAPAEKPTPAQVEPVAPVDEAANAAGQRGGNRANFAALMANPEFAKAMSVQQRAALDARYAGLFKKLNLPPAELEKLKDLLVERQSARMDVMMAAREGGINTRENRDEIRKLTEEAQAEVDANIQSALGDARYNQYKTFEATQPQRSLVSQLDQRLSYSSTPLNSTQSDFLINALAASNTPTTDQDPGNWGGGGNRAAISDAVIQQAQSILSPDQLAALKQLQSEQQAQQKVRDLMRSSGNR